MNKLTEMIEVADVEINKLEQMGKEMSVIYILPEGHSLYNLNRFCFAIIGIPFEDLSDKGKESCFCIYMIMKREHPDADIRDLAWHTSIKVATRNKGKETEFFLK